MTPEPELEDSSLDMKAEPFQWDVDTEVQLFYAMAPYKPVGVNKHFHMTAILEKLSNSIARDITTYDIWRHLETLYDINVLDDTEPIPFSTEEVDFSLPESEFGEYIKKKMEDNSNSSSAVTEEVEEPPSPAQYKAVTPKNKLRSTSKDSKRKESNSSHASTDTLTNKSDKESGFRSERRRDSRDSNTSSTRDSSSTRKSNSTKKTPKSRTGRSAATEAPVIEDTGRGRRSAATSTPPPNPSKRRRI